MSDTLQARITALPANPDRRVCRLPQRAAIRVHGADAERFLQGQLSCDLRRLGEQDITWASFNSPRGRVLALLWVYRHGDGFELQTDASISDALVRRLRMYVLRSQVELATVEGWAAVGCIDPGAESGESLALRRQGEATVEIRVPGAGRRLLCGPCEAVADGLPAFAGGGATPAGPEAWVAEDIRAGLPAVSAETQDRFIAQWLNLDTLGALSFDKGCYTGQEVIARLHWRGGVKRRLFTARCSADRAAPGTVVRDARGQDLGEVAQVAAVDRGLLLSAVLRLDAAEHGELHLDQPGEPTLQDLQPAVTTPR